MQLILNISEILEYWNMFSNRFLKQHSMVGLGITLGKGIATDELMAETMFWTNFCLPFLLESSEVKEDQNLDPTHNSYMFSPHEKVL